MINYSRFERVVEEIQIQKNMAITMGNETFVSKNDIPVANAGISYNRRFTNIWLKKNGN